jgi:hypothetical protein
LDEVNAVIKKILDPKNIFYVLCGKNATVPQGYWYSKSN